MAMVNPHPALKAVSEQACMGDAWLGDDFFHNGAFRLSYGFEYSALMETSNENLQFQFRPIRFVSTGILQLGPLSNVNKRIFPRENSQLEQFCDAPDVRRFLEKARDRHRR